MSLDNLSSTDQARIREFINQGINVLQEMEDLRGGLRDTAKGLAEEIDCKPTILTKAVSAAFKASLETQREQLDDVEALLQIANRA